jgi:hypothetical protein
MSKAVRPIRIVGDIAYVTLTRGFEAIVDVSDIHLISSNNWCSKITRGYPPYAGRLRKRGSVSEFHIAMHRLIVDAKASEVVDHIDGNTLNNRRSNLRISSKSGNNQNARLRFDSTTGYKGVSLDARSGKYVGYTRNNGTRIHVGRFLTAQDAYAAVCKKREELHGEFCRHG